MMAQVGGAGAAAFRYRAAGVDGRVVRGVVDAESEAAARTRIESQGLIPIELQRVRVRRARRRIHRQDLAVVFRSVASLAQAGVPLERAMRASEPLVDESLGSVLGEVRERLRRGKTLADALQDFPGVFPTVVVGMVRAGERGSRMIEAFKGVAEQLEEEANLRSQIRAALAYPSLILVVGIASVLVMGIAVIPRFADILGDLGAELPRSTRMLLSASAGLRRYGLGLAMAGVALVMAGVAAFRRPDLLRRAQRALLRVPFVGSIRMGFASARVCRAVGGMLSAGMPILPALDAARDAVGDLEIGARLARVKESVARGERLTPSLVKESALSPIAIQLVGVGEASGDLGTLVVRAGEVTQERTQRTLRSLVSLLEPAMVILMGLLVAGIAASLLQAVYSVRPGP